MSFFASPAQKPTFAASQKIGKEGSTRSSECFSQMTNNGWLAEVQGEICETQVANMAPGGRSTHFCPVSAFHL
jgi:hypothetical protein